MLVSGSARWLIACGFLEGLDLLTCEETRASEFVCGQEWMLFSLSLTKYIFFVQTRHLGKNSLNYFRKYPHLPTKRVTLNTPGNALRVTKQPARYSGEPPLSKRIAR